MVVGNTALCAARHEGNLHPSGYCRWCKRPWRYAQAEGVELKDVVNLAFHGFFERRQYLPVEE
jgi:hypothetical protein